MLATATTTNPQAEAAERRPTRLLHYSHRADPRDRWTWIDIPGETETQTERAERFTRDNRLVDMYGAAAIIRREYNTVRDMHFNAEGYRRDNLDLIAPIPSYGQFQEDNGEWIPAERWDQIFLDWHAHHGTFDTATFNKIEEKLGLLLPRPTALATDSPVWEASRLLAWSRITRRIDQWYDFSSITGRPFNPR